MADKKAPEVDGEASQRRVHWLIYGQRGNTPAHRVASWEWQNHPFKAPIASPWTVKLQSEQLPILLLGFAPRRDAMNIPILDMLRDSDGIRTHIITANSQTPNVNATEDKWFVYADGPFADGEARLHMHKSWTGAKMMELVIDAGIEGRGSDGTGARITKIIWESEPDELLGKSSVELYKAVAQEVCSWVLSTTLEPVS